MSTALHGNSAACGSKMPPLTGSLGENGPLSFLYWGAVLPLWFLALSSSHILVSRRWEILPGTQGRKCGQRAPSTPRPGETRALLHVTRLLVPSLDRTALQCGEEEEFWQTSIPSVIQGTLLGFGREAPAWARAGSQVSGSPSLPK